MTTAEATKNPFDKVVNEKKGKRGGGLNKPRRATASKKVITDIKDGQQAVEIKTVRDWRVNSNISNDHGKLLGELQIHIRNTENRRITQAEVLEKALDALKKVQGL